MTVNSKIYCELNGQNIFSGESMSQQMPEG